MAQFYTKFLFIESIHENHCISGFQPLDELSAVLHYVYMLLELCKEIFNVVQTSKIMKLLSLYFISCHGSNLLEY